MRDRKRDLNGVRVPGPPYYLPGEVTTKAMVCGLSFRPARARCAGIVVAIHYIAAKSRAGSARTGLFTLLLCNEPHPRRMPRSIYPYAFTGSGPVHATQAGNPISCSNGIGVAVVSNGGSYTATFSRSRPALRPLGIAAVSSPPGTRACRLQSHFGGTGAVPSHLFLGRHRGRPSSLNYNPEPTYSAE
jgi:hypothetical protein